MSLPGFVRIGCLLAFAPLVGCTPKIERPPSSLPPAEMPAPPDAGAPAPGLPPPSPDPTPSSLPADAAAPEASAPAADASASPLDAGAPPADAAAPPPADAAAPPPADAAALPETAPPPPPQTVPPALTALFAASDGDAIEQDASTPARLGGLWDGTRVRLAAARNEIVAFQVVARAGGGGVRELSAELPELRQVGGAGHLGYRAPGADPSESATRPIQIFSVGYMNVTRASIAPWIYAAGSAGAPRDPLGRKPVQLVPVNARPGRGGFPLTVAPNTNQAIWFEIYVPRDLPAGEYRGTITVRADGAAMDLPLELEVFAFGLPDDNRLSFMAYYEPAQAQLYQGRDLDPAYHRFAHRHRIELVHAYDEAAARAVIGRFDGTDFTPAAGYDGPGAGVGNRIVPASFYGPGAGWEDRAAVWQRTDAWISFLEARMPRAITFLYMADQPAPAEYPMIRAIADNVHSNPGPGRRLPIFATREYTSELDGAVDRWCSEPARFDLARAASERGRGRDWWIYNGGRPAGPALVMDAPPTDAREIGWAAFKAGLPVYFYWHSVHWRHNSQKTVGDRVQNVWAEPITFDRRDASGAGFHANGDGVLIYPGTDVLHPEQDRGIAGPIGTITLANLRRGLQDHLYLSLARARGLEPLVAESLGAIVPRVFAEASGAVSFPEDAEPYERARLRLARAIAAASP